LKLDNPIFFHSFGIVDKYLETKEKIHGDLNLIAISSLLIANKFENQNSDFIEDTLIKYFEKRENKIYGLEEIYEIEVQILISLQFDILFPTAYSFYSFYMNRSKLDKEEVCFLYYLIGKLIILNFLIF